MLSRPKNISISEFEEALSEGSSTLKSLGSGFSPIFLLRGFTALRYQNWGDALANLWVSVEQLTSIIWSESFINTKGKHPKNLKGRLESLKDDNRTWSISVKQEILWQTDKINESAFVSLFRARKARNELVHAGTQPNKEIVANLLSTLLAMIKISIAAGSLKIENIIPEDCDDKILLESRFQDWPSDV